MSLELGWTFIISVSLGIFIMAAILDYKLSRKALTPVNVGKVKITIYAVDECKKSVSYDFYLYGSTTVGRYERKITNPDPYEEIRKAYAAGVFILVENKSDTGVAIPASRVDSVYVGKFEEHWI